MACITRTITGNIEEWGIAVAVVEEITVNKKGKIVNDSICG